jgi:hypothetical protein
LVLVELRQSNLALKLSVRSIDKFESVSVNNTSRKILRMLSYFRRVPRGLGFGAVVVVPAVGVTEPNAAGAGVLKSEGVVAAAVAPNKPPEGAGDCAPNKPPEAAGVC